MSEEETATAPIADVEQTPEAAPEAAPTEEVKAEADTDDTVEKEEAEKPKPDPKIAKAKFEARELRRENKRLQKMIETQIETASRAKPEAKAPKIEDFESIEDYLDARDSHRAPAQEVEQESDYQYVYDDMLAHGDDKYEDFGDVVNSSRSITAEMAVAILDVDDPDLQVDVAYYLGQNPKDATRISRLPERRQIAEIAKLEAKLSTKAPAKKKASKAPAPIKPVGGTQTPANEIKESMSYDDFIKVRNKQLGR